MKMQECLRFFPADVPASVSVGPELSGAFRRL